MTPTILIIGKSGQVGWELCRVLAPSARILAVDFPEVDLSNSESIRDCVRSSNPNVIVNAAAYTAVDKAESDAERAFAINATAPGILASEAAQSGALLAHYSTDYVFDGTKPTAYSEQDAPNPLSQYGKSKWAGDQAVLNSGCKHLIFRLCWVYGARGQNFFRTISRLATERESLRVVADQFGCPTWSRMIAEATGAALLHTINHPDASKFYGLYHLAASGTANWQEFAQAIVDSIPADEKKCSEVQPIATADYPLPARRPQRSILDCAKLEKAFGLRLPDWKFSLQQMVEP